MCIILFDSQTSKWGRYSFVSQTRALQPGEHACQGFSLPVPGPLRFISQPRGRQAPGITSENTGESAPDQEALAFGINELQDVGQATSCHAELYGPTDVGLNPDPAVAQRHGTVHLASLKLSFLLCKIGIILSIYTIKLHDNSLRQEFGR